MIQIKNLSIFLGQFSLTDINLDIRDGEYFVILGPSGAGKTVFLECVAGIHRVKQGRVTINDIDVTDLAPEERNIGYVPQDYVLFPFLDVMGNIVFGLRQSKLSRAAMEARTRTLADLLGISHLLARDIRSLSGGEKQRVALARALAPSPRILLLDEPLSSLDLQTSKHLRLELRRIHLELGVTTVHITHNQVEAEEMADRIAILNEGKIEQVGKAQDVFFSPENDVVSSFIGSLNILEVDSCRTLVPGLMQVECQGMSIVLPHDEGPMQKIAISPRDVYVSNIPPPGPSVNRFKGSVISIDPRGALVRIEIKVSGNVVKADIPRDLFEEMKLVIGNEVHIILKLRRLKVLGGKDVMAPEQFVWYYQEII
jgi:molybdate/tungstate transport system ATP-binding protein